METTFPAHRTVCISPAVQRFRTVNTEAKMSARQNTSCALFRHTDDTVAVAVFRTEDLVLQVGFAVKVDFLHEDLGFV